jgi:hypothetical protein
VNDLLQNGSLELETTNNILIKFDALPVVAKEQFWIEYNKLTIFEWKFVNEYEAIAMQRWKLLFYKRC